MTKNVHDEDTADGGRARVAVIGGGIFGTSIAAAFGESFDVVVFETRERLLAEGTFANCFRHHLGYHYPRSDATVREILTSKKDFESVYRAAIVDDYPTYYGLVQNESLVDAGAFQAFCERNQLPFEHVSVPATLMNSSIMSLSVKVPEPSYHYPTLLRLVEARLAAMPRVEVRLNTAVRSVSRKGPLKRLEFTGKQSGAETFDIVVNASYAGINQFAKLLGAEAKKIRIDLTEELLIRLPTPRVSITIIDGPFATLMTTGEPDEFILYHARESIRERYFPEDGLPIRSRPESSNWKKIISESIRYFPILENAEVLESRYALRAVSAESVRDDARLVDIVDYGGNCYSVLSGKILTAEYAAQRLLAMVEESVEKSRESDFN